MQQLAKQHALRISFLSGDVHCCGVGRLYTRPKVLPGVFFFFLVLYPAGTADQGRALPHAGVGGFGGVRSAAGMPRRPLLHSWFQGAAAKSHDFLMHCRPLHVEVGIVNDTTSLQRQRFALHVVQGRCGQQAGDALDQVAQQRHRPSSCLSHLLTLAFRFRLLIVAIKGSSWLLS